MNGYDGSGVDGGSVIGGFDVGISTAGGLDIKGEPVDRVVGAEGLDGFPLGFLVGVTDCDNVCDHRQTQIKSTKVTTRRFGMMVLN